MSEVNAVLHLIVFDTRRAAPALVREIENLSRWQEVHPGCYLVNAGMTAYGIRQQLLPHLLPGGTLIVTTMYLHRCAGKLSGSDKRFVAEHIGPDPIPQGKSVPHRL